MDKENFLSKWFVITSVLLIAGIIVSIALAIVGSFALFPF